MERATVLQLHYVVDQPTCYTFTDKIHLPILVAITQLSKELSLTVCEIFVIFHIFTKSSNKVAITYLCIEQQL